MKAILIDAEKRLEMVESVGFADLDGNDTLLIDEEGRINGKHNFGFSLSPKGYGFVGNGLIAGLDPDTGESISCETSVTQILGRVSWIDDASNLVLHF